MDKIEKLSGKKVPLHVTDLRDKLAVKKVSNFILLFRSFRVRKKCQGYKFVVHFRWFTLTATLRTESLVSSTSLL